MVPSPTAVITVITNPCRCPVASFVSDEFHRSQQIRFA